MLHNVAETWIGFESQSDHPSAWKREILYIFYHVESTDIYLRSGFHTVRMEEPSDLVRFQPFFPVVTGLTLVTRTRPF